ncbi:hypothetical protein Ciccas_006067 [Cichlidogyrus casuarinus]|uniref:C3H1-type domain-containing protein n=1 Tax=Cichlidogyrus casuarinus TaxID=1844966 RepID=A0ABD2Q7D0_9PLAT
MQPASKSAVLPGGGLVTAQLQQAGILPADRDTTAAAAAAAAATFWSVPMDSRNPMLSRPSAENLYASSASQPQTTMPNPNLWSGMDPSQFLTASSNLSNLSFLAAQNNNLGISNLLANNRQSAPSGFNLPATAFNAHALALSMYYIDQMNLANQINMQVNGSRFGLGPIQNPITNVAYMNEKGQLLESLPICRDFKAGKCHRLSECRYVHLVDDNVEVNQGRVTICRDAAKGRCSRTPCKYFHIPPIAVTASRSLAIANNQTSSSFLSPQSNFATPGGSSSMLFCESATAAHM